MPVFSRKRSQETVLKPGLVLPSGGITHQQAAETIQVVQDEDKFLVLAFQGVLCLFLLEISMRHTGQLNDLQSAGFSFIMSDLLVPKSLHPAWDHPRS